MGDVAFPFYRPVEWWMARLKNEAEVVICAGVPASEIPTPDQAIRWLCKLSDVDEVASTTPRKIAAELPGIAAALALATPDTPTPAAAIPDEGEELAAWFERTRPVYNGLNTFRDEIVNPDGRKAAAIIRRQSAEVARLTAALGEYKELLLRAEVDLIEALRDPIPARPTGGPSHD